MAGFDLIEEVRRAIHPCLPRFGRENEQVEAVELLPGFEADLVAHHARVLARLADGRHDGIGILLPEHHELRHRGGRGLLVLRDEGILVAGALHNRQPMVTQHLVVQAAKVQQQLQIHIENARDVFGAFDVARHPVERVGDTA